MLRLASLVCLLAVALPAQITNGSFENDSGGTNTPAGWQTTNTTTFARVLPDTNSCFFETLMPTDGNQWFRISNGGTSPVTTSPASYRANAPQLSQTFSVGPTGAWVLELEVSMKTYAVPGPTPNNDFVMVEVTDGSTFATLGSIDLATGSFTNTSVCQTNPQTDVQLMSLDLQAAFPSATTSTNFTLSVYIANVGNTTGTSHVYVDNVKLVNVGAGQTGVFIEPVVGFPAGWYTLRSTVPAFPNSEFYNFIALTQTVPTGGGVFFGVAFTPEVIDQAFKPLGTAPFHVLSDANGEFSVPPFFLPPGFVSLDAVTVVLQAGNIAYVSPVRAFSL